MSKRFELNHRIDVFVFPGINRSDRLDLERIARYYEGRRCFLVKRIDDIGKWYHGGFIDYDAVPHQPAQGESFTIIHEKIVVWEPSNRSYRDASRKRTDIKRFLPEHPALFYGCIVGRSEPHEPLQVTLVLAHTFHYSADKYIRRLVGGCQDKYFQILWCLHHRNDDISGNMSSFSRTRGTKYKFDVFTQILLHIEIIGVSFIFSKFDKRLP